MNFKVLILTALRSLNRNRKRSILTMLGIVIGIASIITIVALGEGYKNKTIKELTGEDEGNLILMVNFIADNFSENTMSIDLFDNKHKKAVEQLKFVSNVDFEYGDNSMGDIMDTSIRGEKVNTLIQQSECTDIDENIYGRNLNINDNLLKQRVVVISEQSLKNKFDKIEGLVGGVISIQGINFEIVGIKKSIEGEEISFFNMGGDLFIPKDTYNKYFDSSKKPIQSLKITLNKDTNIKMATEEIEEKLNSLGANKLEGKYQVADTSGMITMLGGVLNTITAFIASVAGISLLIAGIGLMNMMYTSVSERIREIGIKRALGARRRDIKREFLVEGVVITLIGGLIGYIFGLIIANLISLFFKLTIVPSILTTTLAIGISIVIGIASSFIPANKAANANTVDILK